MSVIDLSGTDQLLIERAARIRMLVLDVDGVLTDGRLYFDSQGNEMKGFLYPRRVGHESAAKPGYHLALITGRQSQSWPTGRPSLALSMFTRDAMTN